MASPFPDSAFSRRAKQAYDDPCCYIYSDGSVNWRHCSFRFVASCALAVVLYLCWLVSPFSGNWTIPPRTDRIKIGHNIYADYFKHFEGHQECGLTSKDLYIPPLTSGNVEDIRRAYCQKRATLLEAMSGGGRYGFDAPYFARGCHYRWYSSPEICMILSRFDAVVFAGNSPLLKSVYSGLNILLRENLALGSLKQWDMSDSEISNCRCENQFTKTECAKFAISSSDEVKHNDGKSSMKSPYSCQRTPHVLLSSFPSTSSSSSDPTLEIFHTLVPPLSANPTSYRPIPIITTADSLNSLSVPLATKSLDDLVAIADETGRKTPILWLNPTASETITSPHRQHGRQGGGQNAMRETSRFSDEMARVAREREVEVLGFWNMTLQASDLGDPGRGGEVEVSTFGERVAVVQAMMVVNWLSRLESS